MQNVDGWSGKMLPNIAALHPPECVRKDDLYRLCKALIFRFTSTIEYMQAARQIYGVRIAIVDSGSATGRERAPAEAPSTRHTAGGSEDDARDRGCCQHRSNKHCFNVIGGTVALGAELRRPV